MREHITGASVANAIRMKRTLFRGAFVIVEGPTDKRVYSQIVDRALCHIEIAHGRDNLEEAIRILDEDGVTGIAGIVDADVCNITGELAAQQNILRTDLHDLECMILRSQATDRVIREYGSDDRVAAFASDITTISQILAENCVPLGCFRLISKRDGHGLYFDKISFDDFVIAKSLKIDIPAMVKAVVNRSHRHKLEKPLLEQVRQEIGVGHDPWQVSCGHDIVEMLSLALRKNFSAHDVRDVSREVLERSLRIAFNVADLKASTLYRDISEWELTNVGFRVLQI
jgi:hypothetical protein